MKKEVFQATAQFFSSLHLLESHSRKNLGSRLKRTPPPPPPGSRGPPTPQLGGRPRSRPQAGEVRAPGPRARPLSWERPQLGRPTGGGAAADPAGDAIARWRLRGRGMRSERAPPGALRGCSSPRRRRCGAASPPAPAPQPSLPAWQVPPPARAPRSAPMAATSAGSPRASGSPWVRVRPTITRA